MEMTHSIGYSSHGASSLSRGGDLQLLMRIGEKSDNLWPSLPYQQCFTWWLLPLARVLESEQSRKETLASTRDGMNEKYFYAI